MAGNVVCQGVLFVRECCVSGTAVCQGLLFVRDCCVSGSAVWQGMLCVRDYCLLSGTITSGTTVWQELGRDYWLSGTTVFCQGLLLQGYALQYK